MKSSERVSEVPGRRASGLSEKYCVEIYESRPALGAAVAADVAARIRQVAARKAEVRIIFAAAPSQSDMLASLVALPDIPWGQVTAFHMDDYLGLEAAAPERGGLTAVLGRLEPRVEAPPPPVVDALPKRGGLVAYSDSSESED